MKKRPKVIRKWPISDLIYYLILHFSLSVFIVQIVETVATEPMPYDLYYLPWLEEVWVHAWSQSTFDVIDVSGNLEKTHKAIKAHITPGKLLA